MSYLEVCGVAFHAGCGLIIICIIIIPALEAISICRWYAAISHKYPKVKMKKSMINRWWFYFKFGGRQFYSLSNRYGRWDGIGKWRVHEGITDENASL